MSKPNEPAYPYVVPEVEHWSELNRGMSLREYFAARAPAEPAAWFWPVGLGERPPDYKDVKTRVNEAHAQLQSDPRSRHLRQEDFDAIRERCTREAAAQAKAIEAYHEAASKARASQWPWAWADAVLAAAGPAAGPNDAEALEVAVMLLTSALHIVGAVDERNMIPTPGAAVHVWKNQSTEWREAARNWVKAVATFNEKIG